MDIISVELCKPDHLREGRTIRSLELCKLDHGRKIQVWWVRKSRYNTFWYVEEKVWQKIKDVLQAIPTCTIIVFIFGIYVKKLMSNFQIFGGGNQQKDNKVSEELEKDWNALIKR